MSILVRMKQRDPEQGYARDFVGLVMKPLMREIAARGIKVVVNAGGMNVAACAAALAAEAEAQGIALKIGTVEGDDLLPMADALRAEGVTEMFTGAPLPESLVSANAYLGAFPIAAALGAGADVVITGRCVDSALVLGPLVHEFGWAAGDLDLLAAGSMAGHIIECGAQATGGNFTDWREVADGWDDMGYPIAVCRADGSFDVTKPEGTGGVVSRLSVGEQVLYETGDPGAYILPDVVCDFRDMQLEQAAPNLVRVTGIRGHAPTPSYKVSATYTDGWRATATVGITGFEAAEKARAYHDALIKRTRRLFAERNLGDYDDTAAHLIGAQTLWGDNTVAAEPREIVLQSEVRHPERTALEIFSKEVTGVALSMSTGRFAVGEAGRPKVTPVVAQFAFTIDKSRIAPVVRVGGADIGFTMPEVATAAAPVSEPFAGGGAEGVEVPLIRLAVARSGDKGDSANVGLMARSPDLWPALQAAITPAMVADWFAHFCQGEVRGYAAPGFQALNFVLTRSLGGGGTSSLHLDKQAKSYGQIVLAMPVRVPPDMAARLAA